MAKINRQRLTADIQADFVVFIIGMRINKPWKVWKWLPVFRAMPKMIAELMANPDSGFLGADGALHSPISPVLIQYWRSFDQLERYARSKDAQHYPACVAFNKRVASNGDVGIFHETYLVPAGQYECVYNNMPAHGLAKASKLIPASGRYTTAPARLGLEDEDEAEPVSARS